MTAEGKVHRNILQKAVSSWDYVKLHIVTDVFWMKNTSPNSSAVHILLTAEKLNFTSTFFLLKWGVQKQDKVAVMFPWCFSQTLIIIFKFPFLILFHCIFKIHKQHKNWKSEQNSQSLRVHILQQSPVLCLTRSTKHEFPLLLRTKSHKQEYFPIPVLRRGFTYQINTSHSKKRHSARCKAQLLW